MVLSRCYRKNTVKTMKLDIPLRVGDAEIKVVLKTALFRENEVLDGLADLENGIIYLLYPQKRVKNSLLHEILHVISDVYNAKLTEDQVILLTVGLRNLFIDNPSLRFLIKK